MTDVCLMVSACPGAPGLAPGLAQLRTLDLSGCALEAEGLSAVVTEGASHALESLTLDENPLGEEGGAALASLLRTLPNLTRLRLRGCALGDKGGGPGAPLFVATSTCWRGRVHYG